ncbi:transmembrane emp24 domain-containing protein p24beta2-like [Chenopodium quinoa]|uniref:transmembrane emp24 domain-containing protein p24beta2-like n=1 Tax=Chenopodium quinoa TaxID=63459 RepID=UPI000B778056|nr:transmembrane emp24 domain-containing protein p24beta2-like [Chenopodium quinoa]
MNSFKGEIMEMISKGRVGPSKGRSARKTPPERRKPIRDRQPNPHPKDKAAGTFDWSKILLPQKNTRSTRQSEQLVGKNKSTPDAQEIITRRRNQRLSESASTSSFLDSFKNTSAGNAQSLHESHTGSNTVHPGPQMIGNAPYVKGPEGDQILDTHDKISEKFDFTAHKKGPFSFCFTNKSPYHETIDFDVQVGHFSYYDQHAKDEHVKPLVEPIEKLGQSLYNIQFEQHWLEAQTDRHAIVNKVMSKRAIHKAVTESFDLVGTSVLQIYLLWRLFERKLGTSRV